MENHHSAPNSAGGGEDVAPPTPASQAWEPEASQPWDIPYPPGKNGDWHYDLPASTTFTDSESDDGSALADNQPASPASPASTKDNTTPAMATHQPEELLSTQKSSDGLQVALHPLPLLEISDHITRAFQRGHKGAIVGALLGQQNGRHITIEHSFTIGAIKGDDGRYRTDPESFIARLDQMRDVHKNPPIDIVGWYTLVAKTGPTSDVLPIHTEILERYNESAILLGFHLQEILNPTPAPGNPLPITIYESIHEAEDAGKETAPGEDAQMKDSEAPTHMTLRFRELPYSTETGEAEMIAMQFIREGGAHIKSRGTGDASKATATTAATGSKKGKGKETEAPVSSSKPQAPRDEDENLTKEELEQISAYEAQANAIRMMHERVNLLIDYVQRLEGSPFRNPTIDALISEQLPYGDVLPPSDKILRQIQALVTNLQLGTPAQLRDLECEMLQEANDVGLTALWRDVLVSVSEMREVGKKSAIVEAAKAQNRRQQGPGGGGGGSGHPGSAAGDLSLH